MFALFVTWKYRVRRLATVLSRRVLWIAVAVFFVCPALPANAQTFTRSVSGDVIARALNSALAGTSLHLHNLGPLKGASYHAADASSIKWPLSFGPGLRSRFTIPEISKDVLGRRYAYYVNHIRSESITISSAAENFIAILKLSAANAALVGRCLKSQQKTQPCTSLGDDTIPSIDWLDAEVKFVLRPIVFERSFSFAVDEVVIGGRLDIGKICQTRLFGHKICGLIDRQFIRLRARVSQEIKGALENTLLRREVATATRRYLDETVEIPQLGVRSVSMVGGEVRIALAFGR